MAAEDDEAELLRLVAMQNATSFQLARQRAEEALVRANEALEARSTELARSLALMRATLEATTDAILATDHQGLVTDYNEKYLRLWEVSAEAITSRQHRQLLESISQKFSDPAAFLARIEEIYASGQEINDELRLSNGRIIQRFSKIQYLGEQPVGRVWCFRDVTEVRLADELRARLAAVVESSDDAIISKTLEGIITTWNSGAERMFGYRAQEAVGRPVTMLIPLDRADEELVILTKLNRGEHISHYETERLRKDGTRIHVSLTVSPVKDSHGTIIGASKIARDITQRKRADEALRHREADLRTLANSIPQLAWMAHPNGHIFWYNQRWYDYTGTTPEQMEGWGWKTVHDPEILPAVVERWQHSIDHGELFEMEFPLRGADGVYRWFLTRVNPVRDETGGVVRWFGTNTDMDQLKRAEQALRDETRALELLNKTGTLVGSMLDLQQLLQAVTDVATQLSGAQFGAFFYNSPDRSAAGMPLYTLSGISRDQLDGLWWVSLFGAELSSDQAIRSDDVLDDPRYVPARGKSGATTGGVALRSFLAIPVVGRTGEIVGGLYFGHPQPGVFSSRIERIIGGVASQAAVAIDNASLYGDLKRAAEEREALLEAERSARTEAERMSVMKDEFLATLSHELRTPLNAILGWSQLLSVDHTNAESLQQGLESIQRNARAQTQLIEDLLDMSRIISGKVRLDVQRLGLAAVVDAAVDSVRPTAEAKGIRLRKILDPQAGPVSGDPTRLQQVVWNLVSNALKFTPKGGAVDVLLQRVNSHLEITVHDTGVGIKPEFLPLVFERFRQADSSTTRSFSGLGLGLSIVKNLVELHGGNVRAESAGEGQGATFIVNLPLAPVHADENREHPSSSLMPALQHHQVDLAGIKVLVVDDEPDARALVSRVLTQCRADVDSAGSAAEALERIRADRPDVLISDIGMPETDGYQLIREVRRLPANEGGKTPAIALTAFARSEDRTRAMMAGYQVHIAKPIEPQELAATVGSLAGRVVPTDD